MLLEEKRVSEMSRYKFFYKHGFRTNITTYYVALKTCAYHCVQQKRKKIEEDSL